MNLIKTLRWFGHNDPISLKEIAQTGATGVVTALHHIPNGDLWSLEEILKTKMHIESHNLSWEVVESLPVTEEIKKGTPLRDLHISNYKKSIENLAKCGIKTICYNFMPLLDWVRTDLNYVLENGAETMYFSYNKFAAFDLFILERSGAEKSYSIEEVRKAKELFDTLSKQEKDDLGYNIIVKTQSFIDGALKEGNKNYLNIFNELLAEYKSIDKEKLRENFFYFLKEVIPIAEEYDVKLAVHPDDPPFPLLGLPRIMSSEDDFEWLSNIYPSLNNGITFCSGSLGARSDNNLTKIFQKYADRIHFIHLRSTKNLNNGDFFETEHLDKCANLASLMKAIIEEQIRRKALGKTNFNIPIRPDHGHKILDDLKRETNPGYPLIGRLKGLAELSGLEAGIKYLIEESTVNFCEVKEAN